MKEDLQSPVEVPMFSQTILGATTKEAIQQINRKTRRKLAKEIRLLNYHTKVEKGEMLELTRASSRPAGCAFLGAKATEILGKLDDITTEVIPIIIDSGSDITLISQRTLEQMLKPPKVRTGQRINLIQVTGKALISGICYIRLILRTAEGLVKMKIEAYVSQGNVYSFYTRK